jgi:hypothetical protein
MISLVISSWRNCRERVMSSSSIFETLVFPGRRQRNERRRRVICPWKMREMEGCEGSAGSAAAHDVAAPQSRRGLERDRGWRAGVELSLNFGDDEPTLRIRDFDGLVDRRRSDVKDESTTAPLIDSYPPSNWSAPAIDRRSCAWRALFRTTAARSQIVNDLAVC